MHFLHRCIPVLKDNPAGKGLQQCWCREGLAVSWGREGHPSPNSPTPQHPSAPCPLSQAGPDAGHPLPDGCRTHAHSPCLPGKHSTTPWVGNCLLLAAGEGVEIGSGGHTLLWASQIRREGGGMWLGSWGWYELPECLLL